MVIRRLLVLIVALFAGWLVLCAFLFVWPRTGAAPRKADAVIVLSGGGNRRLDPALALVRAGVAPVLVISSPSRDPHGRKARRLCAAPAGSTAFRVLCFEANPYSTQGEAREIARLSRAGDWKHVVVVTSTYHVTRARMLVKRCYDDELTMVGASEVWWRLPRDWATETGKLLVQLTLQRGC